MRSDPTYTRTLLHVQTHFQMSEVNVINLFLEPKMRSPLEVKGVMFSVHVSTETLYDLYFPEDIFRRV